MEAKGWSKSRLKRISGGTYRSQSQDWRICKSGWEFPRLVQSHFGVGGQFCVCMTLVFYGKYGNW